MWLVLSSIDWIAANPYSYNHLTGGGAYDFRNIGLDADVVESLEGGDFACGDIVTYLAEITIDNPEFVETIEFTSRFSANTNGQPGAGHVDIVNVAVNYGTIEDLIPGENDIDDGIIDDGNSTATLVGEYFEPDLASGGGSILDNPNTNADLVGIITVAFQKIQPKGPFNIHGVEKDHIFFPCIWHQLQQFINQIPMGIQNTKTVLLFFQFIPHILVDDIFE